MGLLGALSNDTGDTDQLSLTPWPPQHPWLDILIASPGLTQSVHRGQGRVSEWRDPMLWLQTIFLQRAPLYASTHHGTITMVIDPFIGGGGARGKHVRSKGIVARQTSKYG